ncbi:MAG: hypothetical protein AAF525_23170, partial [Pseudomonadota bacterium]
MTTTRPIIARTIRHLVLIVLFSASGAIHAEPALDRKIVPGQQQGSVRSGEKRNDQNKPDRILPRAPKIDARSAASRVRKTFQDHRVLAINLIDRKGPPVYRVKTLSEK